jgi:hypothetical protein
MNQTAASLDDEEHEDRAKISDKGQQGNMGQEGDEAIRD